VNVHVEGRQIDCIVITDKQATMLDFKNLNGPIRGGINGPWILRDYGGAEKPYDGVNPYQQVLTAKADLANALKKFHRKKALGVAPDQGQFIKLMNAAVCVFPEIATGSSVTKGDFKCRVWSYSEALAEITTRDQNPRWTMEEWTRFSEYLGLENVSLEAAISEEYYDAEKALTAYSQALREEMSAETFPTLPGPTISLPIRQHALIIGPSGIGKTVHLKKHASWLADGDRLVIFCSGRHYTESLERLLSRSVAPFSRKPAAQLLAAASKCGWSVHLIVDGIDGVATNREHDLTEGLAAFALRYGARIIVSSINEPCLSAGIKSATLTVPLLTDDQKLAIFQFHANTGCVPPPGFLAAFETSHDIMVAAKSASSRVAGGSRADYYAAYIFESLPQECKIATGKLLRHLANHLHRNLLRAIEFADFERESTGFLATIGGALKIADLVTTLPQVSTSRGLFSFKHDLWQDYLAAEWLLSLADPVTLCDELSKPINRRLTPHAIGRIRDLGVIGMVFERVCDGELIADGFAGGLGASSKAYLESKCRQVWSDLVTDAATFQIILPPAEERADGTRVLGWPQVTSKKTWSAFELNIAGWISARLHQPETAREFIGLLESSSCSLWSASEAVARGIGFSARQVFSSALHVLLYFAGPNASPTAFGMFKSWEQSCWNRRLQGDSNSELRRQLLDRVAGCRDEVTGALLFCLAIILQHDECPDLDIVSRVFHKGWEQRLRPVRTEVIQMIERHGGRLAQGSPALADAVRSKLEAALGDDPISNTFIFDALNALGAVPPPVSQDDALAELRRVIDPFSKQVEDILSFYDRHPSQCPESDSVRNPLASYACGLVSKFWEDIFQNVYWEAYETLNQPEKVRLMNLAAMNDDICMGEPFVLRELIKFGDLSSTEAFQFHAERVRIDLPMHQAAVAMWCLGIIGCARLHASLPRWGGGTDVGSQAWRLIGELLYKEHIGEGASEEARELWHTLHSEAKEGAADVFLHLHEAEWSIGMDTKDQDLGCWTRLLTHQDHIRQIMEHGLLHLDHLASIAKWDRRDQRASFIVRILGDIGNQSSVAILHQFVDQPTLGGDAVTAIEKINRC
jgi:hypothetical protein